MLPSIILERQDALGLDPTDVNNLMHLTRHSWYTDNPPHPSKASMAKAMGIHPSTVQRHLARMEDAGFIRREERYTKQKSGGQDTNKCHFDGLIKEATPYAEEFIRLRAKQRSENEERRRRK